jgi:hypothetical protein
MVTVTDLNVKRAELNAAIDDYKRTVEEFNHKRTTQFEVTASRKAARVTVVEYAKLMGRVKKDNPTLIDDVLFSNPDLMSSLRRDDVAAIIRTR